MKKLRLVLFEQCNRACPGCCNKDWDLKALPVCQDLRGWDEILLTGGEPMLYPQLILDTVAGIPKETKVILYTAKVDDIDAVLTVLDGIDGITVTLHDQEDVWPFLTLVEILRNMEETYSKSLRVNIFEGIIVFNQSGFSKWKIKSNMTWIKNCPLPQDEVLMRL